MRIAISTDGGQVSAHFGRCPSFTIVDIEGNEIKNMESVDNPGHHPGFIPEFLHKRGVNCIIAGGMGRKAAGFFNQYGIETIVGITGRIEEILDKLKKGTLKSGESLCRPGAGKGYGIEKTEKEEGWEEKLQVFLISTA